MLNKIKKISIIIQILMLIFPTVFALASTVNIGDTINVSRGELGFYTIQYWNSNRQLWMYITYSKTYYTDNEGNKKIAYCLDPDLDGVGYLPGEWESYDTEVKCRLDDEKVWRILKNGYPYVSAADLGVEEDDDAYLATKQAVYWVIRNRNITEEQKGENLEALRAYFRAGQTMINGQNVEDTTRRGEKVVEAIYNLVYIAYYKEDDKMVQPEVIAIGKFEQDENEEYYSQKYQITQTDLEMTINVSSIENAYEGSVITDEDGNIKTTFKSGEKFKIMVPKEKITDDKQITIYYDKTVKSYPMYYVLSKKEGTQNYAILLDQEEIKQEKLILDVKSDCSKVKIIKTDEESKEPIGGVTFEVQDLNGNKIQDITTNEEGIAIIENLKQGKINIVEKVAPNEYIFDATPHTVEVGYNETFILNIKNKRKKGSLEIEKVDGEDNNIVIQGVEFDIINKEGEVVKHVITDENGKVKLTLDIGEYTIKETKTNEKYKIGLDQNVTIKWNEKLELKIENERKKGQLRIVKVDKEDNNIKIEGVKFEVLDSDENIVEEIVTNANGEAATGKLDIGKYYVVEKEAPEKYKYSTEKIEVEVKEDEVSKIQIENEKKRGQIKIIKTSQDKNEILNTEAGTPIEAVKFAIYDENNNLIEELETDSEGIAVSSKLEIGNYKVKEIETNQWYILNEEEYNVKISKDQELFELSITNLSKKPEVSITKKCKNSVKPNEELDYTFKIQNTGNTDLDKIIWYDILPIEYANITKIETGTYNQEANYDIYYKTNEKSEYLVLKKDLSTKENNYIDLTTVHLEDSEKITEIKFVFESTNVGFESLEEPHIYVKVNENIENDKTIKNYTFIEGYINERKIVDEDTAESIVYNVVEQKKLPRTGF